MAYIARRASQLEARYTPEGGLERCGYCRHFVPQGSCNRIIGPVSARGWCKYFSQQLTYAVLDPGGMSTSGSPPGAALDLSFMSSGTLDPSVTFTRGSTATYFNATGTMQTAAVNTPRWDYNPTTLALNGLLIEETRTNVLLNSVTLSTQSVATTAQSYALSFYGTGTITKSGTATGALVGTGASQRVSQVFTPTAGTLTLTVTGSVLNAQLEAGSFQTSYIPTAGAAVTRAADVATVASGAWRNSSAETWQVELLLPTSQRPNCCVIGDFATGRNMVAVAPGLQALSWDSVAAVQTANILAIGAVTKAATTWASPSNGTVCLNAGTVASGSTQTSGFAAVATIKLMDDQSGTTDQTNGYIRRLRYWPRTLSNTEMQQVTT